MNLLAILGAAAQRIGLPQPGRSVKGELNHSCPNLELEDRLRHTLKRGMNRRELFRLAAVTAAVGAPAVQKLIFAPAKTIVLPPAVVPGLWRYHGENERWPSIADTIAAQIEVVRPQLLTAFYSKDSILERLMAAAGRSTSIRGMGNWQHER